MPDVRLIDANALKRLIKSGDDLIFDHVTECEILHMIDYQETIDAQPVKRGKWETKGGVHCTRCGWRPTGRMCDLFAAYCAGCGAKMDGDAK